MLFLASCARLPVSKRVQYPEFSPVESAFFPRHDVTHFVAPGETLWRIGKMYDVGIRDIRKVNGLSDFVKLKMGQRLVIPNAAPLKAIIPLYPSGKWRYIIIHHSATDEDSALSLFKMHLRRGFNNGLGYDFVIANGTCGKKDGQIEVSPRWIKQEDGAHCKAANMNSFGIGVCLVGNFSEERLGKKQLDALVYTVDKLRRYYSIPIDHILGHSQVPGAKTECPGKYFPYHEFLRRLRGERQSER
jgi:N-acetylmuramoyl-L-alanine amidase